MMPVTQASSVHSSPATGGTVRLLLACLLAGVWLLLSTGIASRVHLVMGYAALPAGPPHLEPFLASPMAWLFSAVVMFGWLVLVGNQHSGQEIRVRYAVGYLSLAVMPSLLSVYRGLLPVAAMEAVYGEALWLAFWTSLSFAVLLPAVGRPGFPNWLGTWVSWGLVCLAAGWWYSQSAAYHADFMLGYNDFGHYVQRIANTAQGQPWLQESPVLPRFWDHFNPGLLLLVPLWQMTESVHAFFVIQAMSLALSGMLIYAIAQQHGHGPLASSLWCAAWLVQPVLGQMNLAYTYGWHPISLAIPLLLGALLALLRQRPWLALCLAMLAMSMEEGVIAVVCLFAATCGLLAWRGSRTSSGAVLGLSARWWACTAVSAAVLFGLVYRFSGLAEFQTARFVALGNSTGEVLLSPVLRPAAFWGELLQWEKAAFVLSLWIPCSLLSLWRGRRWLLAAAVPMLVLLVWDHRPADCLAFQYTSTLLPIFWLATLEGSMPDRALAAAAGALVGGLVLSLFVGQLPYSSPSLLDVQARTYDFAMEYRRQATNADGKWLHQQLDLLRRDGGPVLATGRIAAHLVGNRDVETVGQYSQRKQALSELSDRLGHPIKHYRWLALDRIEAFQQQQTETAAVEAEARAAGFEVVEEKFDLVILRGVEDGN